MATENATSISELDASRPTNIDPVGEADDHVTMFKGVIKNTFPDQPGDAWDDAAPLAVGPRQINGWEARIAANEAAVLTNFQDNGDAGEVLHGVTVRITSTAVGADVIGDQFNLDNTGSAGSVRLNIRNSEGGGQFRSDGGAVEMYTLDSGGSQSERAWLYIDGAGFQANYGGSARIATTNLGVQLNQGAQWVSSNVSPEGVIAASVGSICSRTGGGAGTSFYVKESGVGTTGWVAK